MTLRQEVEVHEIHAESDYDEDDEGAGGSEGLASATTDNRPMSIDVYRAPAPGPSAPKPPGQPAIGGGLV